MVSEAHEVRQFLSQIPPFDALDPEALGAIAGMVEVSYRRAGDTIIEAGGHNDRLFVVRAGAVELMLAGRELTARLGEGACFAYPSLLRGGEVRNTTKAIEDTLLYAIPASRFHALRKSNEAFGQFFIADEASRIQHALAMRRASGGLMLDTRIVGELVAGKAPVTVEDDATIAEAVALMHARDVSTLAVCSGDNLAGIFTDKDLRGRVVAQNLPLDTLISAVMTKDPKTLSEQSTIAEAMALMASGGFRHLPLIDAEGALTAILSATDILASIGSNAIDIGMKIAKAATADDLIKAARKIPESFTAMVVAGVQAESAMRFTSALGEAVHRRACELAESELETAPCSPGKPGAVWGRPPCRYALVVFGSLAREEQLTGSDQDNGFILETEPDTRAAAYFEALGKWMCAVLDQCGFVFCKGGIMASNPDQRLSLAGWLARYENWIVNPSQEAILAATIFFDMRAVHGEVRLVSELRHKVLARIKDNPLFVSFLARDALRSRVPLGIFRNLVLEKSAQGEKVFNAKAQAIMPIIDIARTRALGAGLKEIGTMERLRALGAGGHMNKDDSRSLEDALILVNDLRIAHQARQIESGAAPDNAIAPYDLSSLERVYLKDAFFVIRDGLDALRRGFAAGIS